jgi:putative FmdB family regulatory protein
VPTYDYKCKACRHSFEVRKAFHEDPSAVCPVCGQEAQKMFVPVPIVFKGSGFYVNDHRDAGKSTSGDVVKTDSTKPATAETKTATEAAKETKPAAKKEPAGSGKPS